MSDSTRETVIAVIRLIAGSAATVLCCYGFAVDADLVYNIVSVIVAAFIFVYVWWKNNNVTAAASAAQKYLDIAKAAETTPDDESAAN